MGYFPLHKFPEGSVHRYYFLFEKLPDGSALWRDRVLGMEKVELRLQELAGWSNNKFFALNVAGLIDGPTEHTGHDNPVTTDMRE